jgi:RNA polymerase-binding transcription factor DksA
LSSRSRYHENIAIEKTPDVTDDIELSVERDPAIWSVDKRFAQGRYVTAALDRVADGTYGCCLRCDEEIGMKRLAALPHAPFCITCQESAESSEYRQPRFHSTREMIMQEEQIREELNKHWQASAAGDANAEPDIYDDDAICDYPQSGERILGRSNLQALRSHHPGKPSGFNVKRILGKGDLWITEYTITYQGRPAYTVSIMEFRNGKVVHETQYFADPFEAPAWRSQWVQRIA